jgi:hypothetical protein
MGKLLDTRKEKAPYMCDRCHSGVLSLSGFDKENASMCQEEEKAYTKLNQHGCISIQIKYRI